MTLMKLQNRTEQSSVGLTIYFTAALNVIDKLKINQIILSMI